MTDQGVSGWWWGTDRRTLSRVLADQLHAELLRLRLGSPGGPPHWNWIDATRLDELGPAAVDSLDLLSLSAATAELLPDGGLGPGLMQARCFGAWCDAVAGSVRHPPQHVTFRSSGSTGRPKRTTHALACLETEARALASLIGNDKRRVLSAVPSHHAYGFIHSVLLPRHLGGLPVGDLGGCAPADLGTMLRRGDLVRGQPVNAVGVTSSAPCPAETAIGLQRAGLARLLQVYGASETGGIGWRDDPAEPYTLLPGWRRSGEGLVRDEQPVEVPDLLNWEKSDRFRLIGRHDGAVQVGGVNVIPGHVRVVLMQHPAVADVAVRLMRPEEGNRLKAFVVPASNAPACDELRAELHRFATATLAPGERPGTYSFGPALLRTEMGKLADWIVTF